MGSFTVVSNEGRSRMQMVQLDTALRLTAALLLVLCLAESSEAAPRPNTDLAPLRGNGFRGVKGGGWGLKLDALPLEDMKEKNMDLNIAIDYMLSKNNSPSLRLFLNDKLFLHHLKLLLDEPSRRHYQQLQNRFLTLRNRRTDEVSSRFFLRD